MPTEKQRLFWAVIIVGERNILKYKKDCTDAYENNKRKGNHMKQRGKINKGGKPI